VFKWYQAKSLAEYADIARKMHEQMHRDMQCQQQIANSPVAREAYAGKVIEGTSNATQD
jgi:hypothetical protein